MFNRDDAFSMNIIDTSSVDDTSPIIKSMEIDNNLFLFKTDSVYKLLTADTIDPEADYLETRHSYEKLFTVGTNSLYLARMVLQFEAILSKVTMNNTESKTLTSHVWKANKLLLNCNSLVQYIREHNEKIKIDCDQIIERHKKSGHIPPLPQILDLENKVSVFLNTAKMFLIESFKIFNLLFEMPITDRTEAHFDTHIKWIVTKFESEHALSEVLKQDEEWIRLLAECRNAVEHSRKGQSLAINNFTLRPGNKFSEPSWSYDLTEKLGIAVENSNLLNDLDVFMDNMLYFFEEIMLLSIKEELKDNNTYMLYKLNDDEVNTECPILYSVTLNPSFLEKYKV